MVGTQEVRTSKKCGEVGQAGDCMQASQDAVMALLDCNIEMMMTAAAAGAGAEAAKKKKNSLTPRGAVLLETQYFLTSSKNFPHFLEHIYSLSC